MTPPTYAELIATLEQLRRVAADAQWMGRADKEVYWDAVKQIMAKMATIIAGM